VTAVLLRPHHADPATRAELARELRIEHGPAIRTALRRHVRQLAREELANLLAEGEGVGRQRDGIEPESVHGALRARLIAR
jgi:hypothetical protein